MNEQLGAEISLLFLIPAGAIELAFFWGNQAVQSPAQTLYENSPEPAKKAVDVYVDVFDSE